MKKLVEKDRKENKSSTIIARNLKNLVAKKSPMALRKRFGSKIEIEQRVGARLVVFT